MSFCPSQTARRDCPDCTTETRAKHIIGIFRPRTASLKMIRHRNFDNRHPSFREIFRYLLVSGSCIPMMENNRCLIVRSTFGNPRPNQIVFSNVRRKVRREPEEFSFAVILWVVPGWRFEKGGARGRPFRENAKLLNRRGARSVGKHKISVYAKTSCLFATSPRCARRSSQRSSQK